MIKYIIAAILLLSVTVAYSQTALHVSGMIVSAVDGKPVNKAVVLLEGSIHYSYVNNDEGRFHLYLDGMNDTVRFTAKGYETKKLFVNNDSLDMIVVLNEKVEPEVNDEIEVGQGSVTIASGLSGKKSEGVYGASRVEPPMRTSLKFETLTSSDAVKSSDGAEMKTGFFGDTPLKQQAESGLLTAGEVNDFAKWKMWNDLTENDLSLYKDNWNLYPLDRFTVQIENELYLPVYGAKVNLLENDFVVWSSMSDNTGKAELWYNPFTNRSQSGSNLRIEIEYSGKFYNIVKAKRFSEGVNFLRINSLCLKPELTEIAFVVDATGSMGDEINYLKMDLQAIMKEIGDTLPGMKFNLGSVFYRDSSDMYLTRSSDLNADLQKTSDFIEEQNAEGGGDYPEAVHRGLDIAINQLNWSENAMTKLIFLVLDAPPHDEPEVIEELQAFVVKASQKGIRIIPIACSGINKNTEYFLRSIALLTNGTYTFLTDDSGIGNPHIKPSTDKFDVETLKQLIVRLVYQYSYYPECNYNQDRAESDTTMVKYPETGPSAEDLEFGEGFKFYPNPTYGDLNIEYIGIPHELFIADVTGKILMRLEPKSESDITINLSEYPSGMYYLMYQYMPDKWLKGNIMLLK